MAEIVTLTTSLPASSTLRVASLYINVRGSMLQVVLADWNGIGWTVNGREIICNYNGAVADSLMLALNKANLTIQSLHQRVIAQLITDGKIIGVASGTVP